MKKEEIGEIFIDGRIINLDVASDEDLNQVLQAVRQKKENVLDKIDKILEDIQD